MPRVLAIQLAETQKARKKLEKDLQRKSSKLDQVQTELNTANLKLTGQKLKYDELKEQADDKIDTVLTHNKEWKRDCDRLTEALKEAKAANNYAVVQKSRRESSDLKRELQEERAQTLAFIRGLIEEALSPTQVEMLDLLLNRTKESCQK